MPRSLTTANAGEVDNVIVREHFIVLLDFSTPIRLSSRGTVTFDSNTYTGANMELELALDGSGGNLRFMDEDFANVGQFIAQGTAGKTCRVWALYGDSPFSAGDEDEFFNGELGDAALVDDVLEVALVEPETKYMPDIYINAENGFNHLPPDGTEIYTPNGIIVLKKRGF